MIEPEKNTDISIAALKAGDQAEIARMVDTYSMPLYRLALKMLNDPQDAEDVLQETFLQAIRHISGFEGRSSLSTWLYRIAVNQALMIIRRKRPDSVSLDQEVETEEGIQEPVQVVDWGNLPEDVFLSKETRRFMDLAIQRLSPTLRSVFVLRDIEDLSVRETAEALNISETNVKTRLLRARLKLREMLTEYLGKRMME